MDSPSPVLTPDGWRRIPSQARDVLVSADLVKPGPAAERVRCPVCPQPHFERVVVRPGSDGTQRHFIHCPRELRVPVGDDDRRIWHVDVGAIAGAIAASAGLRGEAQSVAADRVYQCGHHVHRGARVEVYLAREAHRRDGSTIAAALPRGPVAPVVVVPWRVPAQEAWPDPATIFLSLRTGAMIHDGSLHFDRRLIENAANRLMRSECSAAHVFRIRGEFWEIGFDGGDIQHLKDSVGLAYLARLLAEPDRSIPAVTLLATRAGIDPRVPSGSAGEELDERGRAELQQKYTDLMEDRDEAERNNDHASLSSIDADLERLSVELSRRLGLGGKPRETTDADRVRRSVTMAVRRDIERIAKRVPDLGQHLTNCVSSGQLFKYAPDREIEWVL